MTMKTQMDKLVGYQTGGSPPGGIDPSQRRGQVTPLPQVISTGPPLSPDAEKEYRPPTEEGSMTIQPVFPTVGSPEYERYLQAIKNLPEGGLEDLPRISEEPDTPTTELSPGGPDTSFVGGRDPSLVVLGLINKDSTPADVMGYIGYVNSEINTDQAPTTLGDVVTTARNAKNFGDTTAGEILGKVTEGKSGLLSFLIGSLFGEKGPSGDATPEQALAIVERAQAESTSALQAQQEARSYSDWSGDVGLAGTPSPQVSAPSAPSGIGQPSVDVGASGPGGTVGTPSGVLALSTGAASPQRSGGLVQNMYDGGVVGMKNGGSTIIVKDNGNEIEFSPPSWFKRASDPSTPTIKIGNKDATVQTTSFYDPDLGGEILVPTIRMDEQGNLYIPDDPVKEAREREDYILIPGEDGKGTRDFATLVSDKLSNMINEARRIQEPKPMYDGGLV